MNQIIHQKIKRPKRVNVHSKRKDFHIEFGNEIVEIPYDENPSPNKKHTSANSKAKKYHWQFIISIIIAIVFLVLLFWKLFQNNKQDKLAKELLNSYQLTTLYSDSQTYETNLKNTQNAPFVIGMIKIEKIQLSYPILSELNDDLLKISLCRFSGPLPNENGNLCIAGHNYLNDRFFSRLDELKIGDLIEVYGLSGERQEYQIFRKYEVDSNNLSCTNQEVGNPKIITLLTCDNANQNKRLIIQAKEC